MAKKDAKRKACKSEIKDQPKKIPAFFISFSSDNMSQELKIPFGFEPYIKGMIPDETFLRDRNGKLWSIEMTKSVNGLYFQKGWARFLEDNCVEFGDYIVFQYDGKLCFDFKLLGMVEEAKHDKKWLGFGVEKINKREPKTKAESSGAGLTESGKSTNCDKSSAKEVKGVSNFNKKELEDEQEAEEIEKEDEEMMENFEDDDADRDDKDEDYREEEEDDDEHEVEWKEERVKKLNKEKPKTKAKSSGAGLSKFGRTQRSTDFALKGNAAAEVKCEQERTGTIQIDDADERDAIFESGLVVRPENPYFVTKIRSPRRNMLFVPVDVIRDHNLKLHEEIIILNAAGRSWLAKVKIFKDGRARIFEGWTPFCKENNMKENDRCICEFVPKKGQRATFLRVRIV